MAKPGEVYDIRGVPIYPGDLLRTFHFRARLRRKKYYLYHVAVLVGDHMEMVPASHLEPSKVSHGGRCHLTQDIIDGEQSEVIDGCGPGDFLDYSDRPKIQRRDGLQG